MEALFAGNGGGTKAAAAAAPNRSSNRPWVEKYRPKTVDEVAMQGEVVAVLKKTLEGHDMPHLLFYGPPGTGKTSTILAISRQLYGPTLMKERVLELNASDERGISVVRDKIKAFAQLTANSTSAEGYPCPPYKIIIMDECDSMTKDAQSALRRTMEVYSKVTRFCLVCNYVSRIIEPVASRCAKFRFKPLSEATQLVRLNEIKLKEEVDCSDATLDRLVVMSGGDLRQAITFMQSAHRLNGGTEVTTSDIEEIAGTVPEGAVGDFIARCKSNSFEQMQEAVTDLVASGFSANVFMNQIHDALVALPTDEATDVQKAVIFENLAQADKALVDGADETLQLMHIGGVIMTGLCS